MDVNAQNEYLGGLRDLLVCDLCGSGPVTHVLMSGGRKILEPLRVYCTNCAFCDDGLDEVTSGPLPNLGRMACWACNFDGDPAIDIKSVYGGGVLSLSPTYLFDDLCSRDSRMCAICDQRLRMGRAEGRRRALESAPDLAEAEFLLKPLAFREGYVEGFVDAEWK